MPQYIKTLLTLCNYHIISIYSIQTYLSAYNPICVKSLQEYCLSKIKK